MLSIPIYVHTKVTVYQIIYHIFGQQNDSICMIELSLFKQEMRNFHVNFVNSNW